MAQKDNYCQIVYILPLAGFMWHINFTSWSAWVPNRSSIPGRQLSMIPLLPELDRFMWRKSLRFLFSSACIDLNDATVILQTRCKSWSWADFLDIILRDGIINDASSILSLMLVVSEEKKLEYSVMDQHFVISSRRPAAILRILHIIYMVCRQLSLPSLA